MMPSILSQAQAAAPWLWVLLAVLAVVATVFWLAGRGGESAKIPPGKTTGREDPHGDHAEFMDDRLRGQETGTPGKR